MIATSRPDVSVIVVSYNTREMLRGCLTAVERSSDVSIELFVVDNSSRDGSADMVAADFPWVQLIRNPDNRGFAAANNIAIPRAAGRFILLLNPDTVVRPDAISTLARYLTANPDVGICGPLVVNPDGSQQSSGNDTPPCSSRSVSRRTSDACCDASLGPSRRTGRGRCRRKSSGWTAAA